MLYVWSALCAVVLALIVWSTSRPAVARQRSGELVSWVVLTPSPMEIDIDGLRHKLDAAFPGEFLPPDDRRSFVVVGGPSPDRYLIRSTISGASGLYLVHIVAGSYTRFSNLVHAIADPDLRLLALAQCCWLSVDRIDAETNDHDAYRLIGGALAQLAPDDAAVLFHPSRGVAMKLDAANRRRLAAGLRPN